MGKWTENELTTPLRNVYLKSCIHLKSENVNIEIKGAACENFCIFQILHFKIGKWTQIELTSPKEKYNLLHNLSGRGGKVHTMFSFSQCVFLLPQNALLFPELPLSRIALLFSRSPLLFSEVPFSQKCPIVFQNCPFVFQKCQSP